MTIKTEQKKGFIYKISNTFDDDVFIGYSTTTIASVKSKNRNDLLSGIQAHSTLYTAMNLHGLDAFSYDIIEYESTDKLLGRKNYWIAYYDSVENGYNLVPGKPHKDKDYDFRYMQGSNHSNAKLNEGDVRSIRRMLETSMSQTEIAKRFEVTPMTISYIKHDKSWTHPEAYPNYVG